MNKVFIIVEEERGIPHYLTDQVFSTKEKAEKWIAEQSDWTSFGFRVYYHITELKVK